MSFTSPHLLSRLLSHLRRTRARRSPVARRAAALLLAGMVVSLPAAGASAQQQRPQGEGEQEERPSFGEEARVTAIDLTVAVRNLVGGVPAQVSPGDLRVMEGGEAQPVVGVAPLGSEEGAEPWRVVIYFDLALSAPGTVGAGVITLAERVDELTALGEVEVVVADPSPRPVLNPTRDPAMVETALSRVLLDFEARDALNELRRSALREVGPREERSGQLPAEITPGEIARAAVAEELSLVHQMHDALLTWAAADPGTGPRALLLVSGGFDVDPGAFYRARLAGVGDVGSGPRELGEATRNLGRTLAGYGWLVYPVVPRDFGEGPSPQDEEFEEFRRRSLEGPEGDDKVLVPLTKIPLGKKAREERRQARRQERGDGGAVPAGPLLADPLFPLGQLAEPTSGEMLERVEQVPEALAALDGRWRVTYQVNREVDGRLHPVEVESTRAGLQASAPRWVRSSTPEMVAEARVRRMLVGELEVGDLALTARFRREAARGDGGGDAEGLIDGTLTVQLDLTAAPPRPEEAARSTLRLTVAHGVEDGTPSFQHQVLEDEDLTGDTWSHSKALTLPTRTDWLLVLVEDLATGSWGARDLTP